MFNGALYFLPLVFIFVLLVAMSIVCAYMNIRAHKKNYLSVSVLYGLASLPFIYVTYYSIDHSITPLMTEIAFVNIAILIVQASFYFQSRNKNRQPLYISIILVIASLLCALSPFTNARLIPYVLLILSSGYYYFTFTKDIPHKTFYQVMLIFTALAGSMGLIGAITSSGVFIFLYTSFLFVSMLVSFLLLQEQIIHLLLVASYSSIIDPLTGLFNRRYFTKQVSKKSEDDEFGIIFCDIDNFKRLNDTQGHDKGDEVLKAVASIIQEEMHIKGIAARYGGEEMIALVDTRNSDIFAIAESIRKRTQEETIVTLSIGVATTKPGEHVPPTQLIDQADKYMYAAKSSGKNKVCTS